ncbi:hypothetical protein B0O99DRAFT_566533 [Bisporella sp. PMI_857]|nr:hypothetical protein B0O99DRAFT_566533 [Bisporella sp. PMI_857]
MQASRTAARVATRSARAPLRVNRRNVQFASTNQQAAAAGGSSGLVGGLVGGSLVFAAGYGYYHFSGAKTIVNTASATKAQIKALTANIQSQAPEPNQALKWLRSTASSYAAFIPGAKAYVDGAFDDLDKVHAKHSDEVEVIVQQAYKDLKEANKSGMTAETATKSWTIIEDALKKLGELAADSATDILDNQPQIKEQFGSNLDQLKKLADNGGEEAKKELEATYNQIKDVVAGGAGVDTIAKLKKIIQEKTEKVQKLGDEAWKKGLESVKPYFDKNPKVKEIVEENADALRSGNLNELWERVKEATSSGNTDKLQQYVRDAGEKTKNSGVGQGFEKYAKMIPGGSEILPKLQKLQEVAQKHGDEAEKILKAAYKDIQDVLQRRIGEVEKLGDKVKKDAKN